MPATLNRAEAGRARKLNPHPSVVDYVVLSELKTLFGPRRPSMLAAIIPVGALRSVRPALRTGRAGGSRRRCYGLYPGRLAGDRGSWREAAQSRPVPGAGPGLAYFDRRRAPVQAPGPGIGPRRLL